MKTMKTFMMILVAMIMIVMVLPNTSAKAAKTPLKKNVYLAINDGENDKISKETAKYTLKLTGVSKKAAKKAKWSSANKKIATVNKKGIVTGKKHGSTTITCKVGKTKYTCTVYVNDIQKVIKDYTKAMYPGNPGWVHMSVRGYTLAAYSEGKISEDEISDSTSMKAIGFKVKINGHWYFFYYERWIKSYANIKEGRLNSKNVNDKCNKISEINKAKNEKEKAEAQAKAQAEKEAKEKAEAEALAKAQAEAQAKAEAEAKAKAEAEAKAKEDWKKEIEANGGTVTELEDGTIMITYD